MGKMIGKCRFCGQTRMMEYVGDVAQTVCDEDVTYGCYCAEAKAYKEAEEKKLELKKSILSAEATIMELFHENHKCTEQILKGSINLLVNEVIQKVTVKINENETATINKVNNRIIVNHTIKRTVKRETSI